MWSTPWGWPALTGESETVRGVLVELRRDRVDDALADRTLLQLLRSRPRSFDPEKNPVVAVGLITDLHDAMVEHGDHELASAVLELARYPAKYWVPSCSAG